MNSELPPGHILVGGTVFVPACLFDAACQHVTDQGVYCNQLVETLNRQGAELKTLRAEAARLRTAGDEAQAAQQRAEAALNQLHANFLRLSRQT